MSRQSKERLLGFLLLLAIAAIFLPIWLDGEGVRQGQLQAVIPERPETSEIVHYQPQYQQHEETSELAPLRPELGSQLRPPPAPIDNLAQKKKNTEVASKASAKPAVKPTVAKSQITTDKPVLDQHGIPAGWTLQLASFKEPANAVALQQKLLKQGYKVYIRDKGGLSKVFIGPDLQKSLLEEKKRELKQKFKLDGLVLRFRP